MIFFKLITIVIPSFPLRDVNNMIMETLITSYACKSNSCKNIIGVFPYLPYSNQSEYALSIFHAKQN